MVAGQLLCVHVARLCIQDVISTEEMHRGSEVVARWWVSIAGYFDL